MIFTNQALALFPPALGQAIAHTQRDRQELVEGDLLPHRPGARAADADACISGGMPRHSGG